MKPYELIGLEYRLGSDPVKHGTGDCLSLVRTVLGHYGFTVPKGERDWYRRLRKKETMTTGDVESLYEVVCEEYEQEMKSHTTIWKYLKELENRQIIVSRIDTIGGGRGRTTHLSMPHFLPTDIANRVEMLLKKRLK